MIQKTSLSILIKIIPLALMCIFHVTNGRAQAMTRPDKLFIKKGIQFQAWANVDEGGPDLHIQQRTSDTTIRHTGRYVRIQLSATEPLSMAEVQVFSGGTNVALYKSTSQSSDINATQGKSGLAVDGNTDGVWADGSVTHTLDGYAAMEPWWQVDLGSPVLIDSIVIWSRMDCCTQRLRGFYLFVSDNPFASNTLAGTLAQTGVTRFVAPDAEHYPSGPELANIGFTPTYTWRPLFNDSIFIKNPTSQWSMAMAPDGDFLTREPSSFELSNGFLNSLQLSGVNKLSSICFGDEENYSTAQVTQYMDWFQLTRAKYPDVLVHNNFQLGRLQWSTDQIRSYMQAAQPDLLTYDAYYFDSTQIDKLYPNCQIIQYYRQLALGGYDGTGASPIAYGGYLQGTTGPGDYYPSESEINLGGFVFMTMGAKWMNIFRYHFEWGHVYIFGADGGGVTPQYWQYASLGKQIYNLSPHLSRLRSTDIRFIPGKNASGATTPLPNNIVAWDQGADPYIKSIVATNLIGATNNGQPGNLMVGYFKPVPGLDNTPGITMAPVPGINARYFMVLNGLSKRNGATGQLSQDTIQGKASLARQKITFSIDFGTHPLDTLYRVRRSDGAVEMMQLTPAGGSQYNLTDTLDGGLGDLFYWKNAGLSGDHNAVSLSSGNISAGDVTQLKSASKFTLESWVKFNTVGSWSAVLAKFTSVNDRILIQTGPGDNSLYVMVGSGTSNNYGYTGANAVTAGQWYHVAVVYDGTQGTNATRLKLYLNGVQQTLSFWGTIPANTTSTNAAPFLAGSATVANSGTYLNGTLDEVRVWNTALSASTISSWMNKSLGACHPNYSNLVLYWPLDSIPNSMIVAAALGTSYTGTITNGLYVPSAQATGSSGCLGGSAATQRNIAAIGNTLSPNTNIKIYPNPVGKGSLHLEITSTAPDNAVFSIIDIAGRNLLDIPKNIERGLNNVDIDVSGLAPGTYILAVRGQHLSGSYSFVRK